MKHLLKSNQKIVSSKGFQNYKLNITDGNKAKLFKKNSNSSRVKLLTGREAYNDQLHSLYELLYKIIESSSKIENSKEYNSDEKEHNSD
jgi:hypothetical protein